MKGTTLNFSKNCLDDGGHYILNIDVEGMDFQVLQSNDWQKYRPKIVLVEILDNRMEKIGENGIFKLLKSNNYSVVAKSFNTVFFEDDLNPANKLDHGE